jgi:hypothetical protein
LILGKLINDAPTNSAHLSYFAKQVAEAAQRRRAQTLGRRLDQQAQAGVPLAELLASAQSGLMSLEVAAPVKRPRREMYRPFPVDVLPEPTRSFARDAARSIGCDAAFVVLPLLASLAAAIGATRAIRIKSGWREPCILWTGIVGDSGTGKTPGLSAATAELTRIETTYIAEYDRERALYEQEKISYESALTEWKRQKQGVRGEPPGTPAEPIAKRLVVSDTTAEALAERLRDAPRGLLVERDELAGWLSSFDQYKGGRGGADVAQWLSLYNAKPLRIDRKTGATKLIYVARPAVSIAGGIQPDTLRRAMRPEYFQNGLAARLLLAYPPKRPRRWNAAAEIGDEIQTAMRDLFERLLALDFGTDDDGENVPIDLPMTPAAMTEWEQFYNDHNAEQASLTGSEAALWSKLEGTTPRLALIIHLVRTAAADATLDTLDAVDASSLTAAITLARWFGHEGRRIYGVLGESDEQHEQRRLIEWIEARDGRASVRDVQRGCTWLAEPGKAEAALAKLFNDGCGRWQPVRPTGNGGRPTREFVLHSSSTFDETSSVPRNS